MRPVAKWTRLCRLTATKPYRSRLIRLVHYRGEAGLLVRAVAEGLLGAAPASAPPILPAGRHLGGEGRFLGYFRCVHESLPSRWVVYYLRRGLVPWHRRILLDRPLMHKGPGPGGPPPPALVWSPCRSSR